MENIITNSLQLEVRHGFLGLQFTNKICVICQKIIYLETSFDDKSEDIIFVAFNTCFFRQIEDQYPYRREYNNIDR